MLKKEDSTISLAMQRLTEQAEAELQRIAQEQAGTRPRLDVMDFNGIE